MTKYVMRYDNHSNITCEEYNRIHTWCGGYEIPIKYIGKSKRGRCHYLQIEVGVFLASFLLSNWKGWFVHKEIA